MNVVVVFVVLKALSARNGRDAAINGPLFPCGVAYGTYEAAQEFIESVAGANAAYSIEKRFITT